MHELLAHPNVPDTDNFIRRTDDNARKTQNFLAVVGNHDTRAISLE